MPNAVNQSVFRKMRFEGCSDVSIKVDSPVTERAEQQNSHIVDLEQSSWDEMLMQSRREPSLPRKDATGLP